MARIVLITLFIAGLSVNYCTQVYADDSDINHDISLLMGWWSDQFAKVISFGGSSEINVIARTLPEKGFSFGYSGSVNITNVDINAYKRLDLYVFPRGGEPPFTQLPMVNGLLHVKYGFSRGYDIGIKSGGLTLRTTDNALSLSNNVLGAEMRMQMLEEKKDGFDLVGSMAVNSINGGIKFKSSSKNNDTMTEFGSTVTYNRTYDTSNSINVDWGFTSINLKGIASRKFSFFAPFAGMQVDLNMGKTNGEFISLMQNIRLTQTANPANTKTSPDTEMSGAKSSTIPQVNLRILYGFDLIFGKFRLWYSGESASDNTSFGFGLRYQTKI